MISKRNILIVVAVGLVALLSSLPFVRQLEHLSYDALLRWRPAQIVDDRIVIIAIDDTSLEALGVWPLPRDYHASLVDVLTSFKVKNIVFDLLFSEPSGSDEILAESLRKAGNVFLPQAYAIEENSSVEITPVLKGAIKSAGHINVLPEADGKARRIPLKIRDQWPVSLLIAADALGTSPEILSQHQPPEILVNYPGTWEKSFKVISYAGLLRDFALYQESGKASDTLRQLEGKTCLIGLTATGTSDFGPMPLEPHYPKVGLQASVVNSFLTGHFIQGLPAWVNAALSGLAVLLGLWIGGTLTSFLGFGVVLLVAVLYMVTAWVSISLGLWVYMIWPLFSLGAGYLVVMSYRLISEERERLLLEKELDVARRIQQSFLPKNKLDIEGVSVVSFFRPAKFVAGDLYDIWKIDEHRVGVFVGDVSGKGVSAALVMAEAISVLRTLAAEKLECHQLLSRLNKQLHGRMGGRFVTALFFIIDTLAKKVYAVSAGHGPLLILRAAGQETIDLPLKGQVPLGLMADVPYETVSAELKAGDRIIVFSDGLPEARNKNGEEFGSDQVLALINGQGGRAAEVLARLEGAVEAFSTTQAHDDITIVVAGLQGD